MNYGFPNDNYDWLSRPKITLSVDSRRYERVLTQSFHIITPPDEYRNIFILGSTGNEYIITITSRNISCNCPDTHMACKHILFILHIIRLIQPHDTHVTIYPSQVLPLVWKHPQMTHVKAVLLDSHTNLLCFRHQYPPCLWCRNGYDHIGSTIILCSKCGYLGHKHCFVASYIPGSNCPKCSRPFFILESSRRNGFRNYINVLQHFDYVTPKGSHVYKSGSKGGLRRCRCAPPPPPPPPDVPLPIHSSNLVPPSPSTNHELRDI